MDDWKRRAIGYFVLLSVALLLTALGYRWGMRVYEGRPRTFLDSLQFAIEMFTTTGFGGDSPWTSPQMQAFIAVTDLLGMALLVGALPVFIAPLLENVLSTTAPERVDDDVSDHVVLCSYTTRAEELITELDSRDVPYVILESDPQRADELYEAGHPVIKADPQSTDGLEAARLPSARALFADVSDRVDASIVLTAREIAEDLPIISVVEDPARERYHRLAGADQVFSPRQLLGESLAQKVTTARRTEVDDILEIDDEIDLAEVSIQHGSRLAGRTLADSDIREQTGVNVIGAWVRGEFDASPSPDETLVPGTVLLVSGRRVQLDQLVELTQSSVRGFGAGKTVVVGYGTVGQTVADKLDEAEISYTVVDHADGDGVDVVGDATKPEVLSDAGVESAETVVIALPDDTTTEFSTLVVRDLAPEAEILARIEENANISKTYRAGADYVLSLSTVTGRMSASYLLEDREVLSLKQQVVVMRTTVPELSGLTIGEANIRKRTDCTVVAINRETKTVTDIGPRTAVLEGDELVVVGSNDGIREFEELFA